MNYNIIFEGATNWQDDDEHPCKQKQKLDRTSA